MWLAGIRGLVCKAIHFSPRIVQATGCIYHVDHLTLRTLVGQVHFSLHYAHDSYTKTCLKKAYALSKTISATHCPSTKHISSVITT